MAFTSKSLPQITPYYQRNAGFLRSKTTSMELYNKGDTIACARTLTRGPAAEMGEPSHSHPSVIIDDTHIGSIKAGEGIRDPITGFVSVTGEYEIKSTRPLMPSLNQLAEKITDRAPQMINSIRKDCISAPFDTRRETEQDPFSPTKWHSTQKNNQTMRAELGAYFSKGYLPKSISEKLALGNEPPLTSGSFEDKKTLADFTKLKVSYTSSGHSMNGDVNFDSFLHPKRWPAASTIERYADPLRQSIKANSIYSDVGQWKQSLRTWDRFAGKQLFLDGQPVDFCSKFPRAGQIPNYSGEIYAQVDRSIDDRHLGRNYEPATVMRTVMPKYAESSWRPNIPGYSGSTLYLKYRHPAHFNEQFPKPTTYMAAYRHHELPQRTAASTKYHDISNAVTTVQPANPFSTPKVAVDAK